MSKKLLIAAAILMTSGLAHADRSKFFLAGGLGYGTNSMSSESSQGDGEIDGDPGLISSVKIGGVINQQHALYYHRQASWFSFENARGQNFDVLSGVMGIGYTFYTEPTIGSPYVEASIGLGDFVGRNNTSGSYSGTGFLIGAGYELNEHTQFGATFMRNITTDSGDDDFTNYHNSISAKVEFKL